MSNTELTVMEGNKLIAEFMGLGWHNNGTISHYLSVLNMRMGVDTVNDLKFHTSWDWLMPVVEKIGQDYEFMIDTYVGIEVSEKPMQSILCVDRDESIPLIQQTWQAVVQFIQWFNNSKNSSK